MIDLDTMSGIGAIGIWARMNLRLVLSIALLVCPICLTLSVRRRASGRKAGEGIESWFRYRLDHRSVTFLFVALWCALWDWNGASFPIPEILQSGFALLSTPAAQSVLFWVLPVAFLGVNEVIFYATDRRINELHWSRSQILRQGIWEVVRYVVPLFLIAACFEYIYDGAFAGIIWIVLALPVAAVGKLGLERALGFNSRLLKTGELRNRAFKMARKMDTELRQVYIVPQGRGHLTNAYAGGFRSISLTDTLSQNLNYREVDCTIAHELAHLKLRHVREYFLILTLPYVLLMVFLFRWPSRFFAVRPLLDFIVILVPILIFNFNSRRREYAADCEEVTVLRDPEASIRSLAKLHRISHVPGTWSHFGELFSSHPSLERRVRAIARAGNLPDARAAEILEEVGSRGKKTPSQP